MNKITLLVAAVCMLGTGSAMAGKAIVVENALKSGSRAAKGVTSGTKAAKKAVKNTNAMKGGGAAGYLHGNKNASTVRSGLNNPDRSNRTCENNPHLSTNDEVALAMARIQGIIPMGSTCFPRMGNEATRNYVDVITAMLAELNRIGKDIDGDGAIEISENSESVTISVRTVGAVKLASETGVSFEQAIANLDQLKSCNMVEKF